MRTLFAIVCLFLVLTLPACKKSNSAANGITKNMGGARNWHRKIYSQNNPPSPDTLYYPADTSFALTIVDANAIDFNSHQYKFYKHDSVNNISYFGTALDFVRNQSGTGFIYYHDKDSIVYVNGDHSMIHAYTYYTMFYTF